MTCPMMLAWAIASGAVLGYDLYVDGVIVYAGPVNQAEYLCVDDGQVHEVVVRSHMSDGTEVFGESMVGTYTEWWIESGFPSGGPPTPTATPTPTPQPLGCQQHPAVCADLDGDGVVGFTDYGIWVTWWGACNDGVTDEPCQ